jgi:hypothetical protein
VFKNIHIKISLRFRYWSRKSYAAFKSIGRHVTIGHLKNIIADTLLGKQKNDASLPDTLQQTEAFYNNTSQEDWSTLQLEISTQKTIQSQFSEIEIVKKYISTTMAESNRVCFQPFFLHK